MNYNKVAILASRDGDIELLNQVLNKGASNYEEIAVEAARMGHSSIVLDMIMQKVDNIDKLINIANYHGHHALAGIIERQKKVIEGHYDNDDLEAMTRNQLAQALVVRLCRSGLSKLDLINKIESMLSLDMTVFLE